MFRWRIFMDGLSLSSLIFISIGVLFFLRILIYIFQFSLIVWQDIKEMASLIWEDVRNILNPKD